MKNYQEIYNNSLEAYKVGRREGATNYLNKLTKRELLELNRELNISEYIKDSYSKKKNTSHDYELLAERINANPNLLLDNNTTAKEHILAKQSLVPEEKRLKKLFIISIPLIIVGLLVLLGGILLWYIWY